MENSSRKRNTRQKAAIERVVLSACDHPTAETVCDRVKEEIPSVSLGTVYRVLKGLAAEGKVREISVPDAPSRFDKTTHMHAHFVCLSCGKVEDIAVGEKEVVAAAAKLYPHAGICEAEIILKGYCPDCKEKSV